MALYILLGQVDKRKIAIRTPRTNKLNPEKQAAQTQLEIFYGSHQEIKRGDTI